MKYYKLHAALALALFSGVASATPFTITSPINGGQAVSTGVSEIGGVVFDALGLNNTRVTSQLAASTLFTGFASGNPLTIGTQTGFTGAITGLLGGGFSEVAIRFTLFDGDSAPGDFDAGTDNTLLVNGVDFGFWSGVSSERTSSDGLTSISTGIGFGDNILSTGWFFNNDATALATLFSSITGTTEVVFRLNDVDPGDNFFDFTQGVDGSLINTGQGPTTGGNVPEPASLTLFAMGLLGFSWLRRKSA